MINQNDLCFELLLIDDGSSKLCDEYLKMKNVKGFHKRNEGASSVRSIGLIHAIGQYKFFLDSDDFYHLNDEGGLACNDL